MKSGRSRVVAMLGVYAVWAAITLIGGQMVTGGEQSSLNDLVQNGIGWHFAVACLFLIAAIAAFKWNDLRFTAPHSLLKVLWFPTLYLIAFVVGMTYLGLPNSTIIMFVFINTMMVGFSEEVMFRGAMYRAFEGVMRTWPAILLTCLLFGAVHTLNVFITGDLLPAVIQSVAAAMSGLVFMAILIRTGSIWPAIIYHGLWDCFIFLMTTSVASDLSLANTEAPGSASLYAPILFNLPNVAFALIMLRNVGRDSPPPSHASSGAAPA